MTQIFTKCLLTLVLNCTSLLSNISYLRGLEIKKQPLATEKSYRKNILA